MTGERAETGAHPILYSFRRCPYAMRARMALLVSGQPCALREVVLRAKPAAMIAASEKATVPVLVLSDGEVIDESLDIMRWALARNDPEDWLCADDPALVAENDGPFKQHLDGYKYPDRQGSDPVEHRAKGMAFLTSLEARLAESANLSREARSFTDIAIMPFVRQFAATDQSWFEAQSLPRLKAWLARHQESPLFLQAMLRLPPWQPGDPLTLLAAR
ncbi:MAG: glutathione S-transferase [Sphingomonas sp.]